MNRNINLLASIGIALIFGSCSNETSDKTNETKEMTAKSINPANMDTTVLPGNDFYMYANGNWIKNNPIAEEFSVYGSFHKLKILLL